MIKKGMAVNKKLLRLFVLFLSGSMLFGICGCIPGRTSLSGKKLVFETTDLDGNPVSSGELFARHEITMLNLWAGWCGPCVGELSELNEVNEKLMTMDGAVVGLLNDDKSQENLDTVRRVLSENDVQYLNILAPDNMNEIIRQSSFPMTVFVDREGVIIGRTLLGTVADKYVVDYYMDAANNALEALKETAED